MGPLASITKRSSVSPVHSIAQASPAESWSRFDQNILTEWIRDARDRMRALSPSDDPDYPKLRENFGDNRERIAAHPEDPEEHLQCVMIRRVWTATPSTCRSLFAY